MFRVSRQSVYQAEERGKVRHEWMRQVRELVLSVRMKLSRLGTRKLYYMLKGEFAAHELKIGRDKLFSYLKAEHLLIQPRKNYTLTTNSRHWLKKHPNLRWDEGGSNL